MEINWALSFSKRFVKSSGALKIAKMAFKSVRCVKDPVTKQQNFKTLNER